MKNYLGGLFALVALSMGSAFADEHGSGCGCGGKGKLMGSSVNAPAPVVSKTAPAAPAQAAATNAANTTPAAKAPLIASKDAKDSKTAVSAPADNLSEDDSEDDE